MGLLGLCPNFVQGVVCRQCEMGKAGQTASLRVPVLNRRTALEKQEPSQPCLEKLAWGSLLI